LVARITRRTFFKRAGVCAGAAGVFRNARAATGAGRKPQLAAIGVAGRGQYVLPCIAGGGRADVVALCDVDEKNLDEASSKYPEARKYTDWRELFEQEGDRIDHVCIATPDHSHAPAAISALRAGKHVFCEKPLTHSVYEARQVAYEAYRAGVATQMGIQKHGHAAYRQAVQLIRDGAIGKVKEWHSWCKSNYWRPGMARPVGEDPVPAHLHWDLWLGVAPERPYKKGVYHPGVWRRWRDFGAGVLGDFGCHIFDPVFTALGLGAPDKIIAEAPETDPEVWPSGNIVRYQFPGTVLTVGKTIEGTWYDGGKRPPSEWVTLPADETLPENGSLIIGEDGMMILPHCDKARLYKARGCNPLSGPVERFAEYPVPDVGHVNIYEEWLEAGNSSSPTRTGAGFDYAGPLTEAVLLGAVATAFSGKTLEWDAAAFKVTNVPEANALLSRPYRAGWEIPAKPA